MEASFQNTQDSRSLKQFFKPTKPQIMKEKREMKQIQSKRRRKDSTQLSLFGWLLKNRPKQNCLFIHLPKNLIVNIYSYLRISDIVEVSQTCFYLYQCAKTIWHDQDFFKELQTDKLSYSQLKKIFQKGGKMGHIKQLKNIYMGKNLKSCRQKIKVKVHETESHNVRPVNGNLLQVFEVSTKAQKSSAFIMDNHLQEVINSSFRSLSSIKLQSCRYLRKFYDISKCTQLISLSITQNSYLTNQDIRVISKNCIKIEYLDLSGCDGLDQGIFKHIAKMSNLKVFILNNYMQPFGDLQCMKPLTNLKQISIENSCIMDNQAVQLVKQLQSLQKLNINGCQLLTDFFLQKVMSICKFHTISLSLIKTKFGECALNQWANFNEVQKKNQTIQ